MTALHLTSTYLLAPHNIAPGARCRGWTIGKEDMVPRSPAPGPDGIER